MAADRVRLGIDFGTAHTVAVLELPGRDPRPLMFDGSPLMPSAVCVDPGGRLVTGRDALYTALAFPAAFEPHPKRCVDDQTVLLGQAQVPVEELIAAPLRRVAAEAALVSSAPVAEAVITCPAAWGARRRETLLAAARLVLPTVRLVTEPVAAACFFVEVAGHRLGVGEHALVYDFGAGTFDASVIVRTDAGLEVVASEGLPNAGGLDIDAAIVQRLAAAMGERDRAAWARIMQPTTAAERRASRELWDNTRAGKEMLSRSPTTLIHVPIVDVDAPVGREELDEAAAPVIAQTIEVTRGVLRRAGVDSGRLAAVFLSGGSSRLPAVGVALHRALGVAPSMVEQPELAVAEGSLRVAETVAVAPRAPAAAEVVKPASRKKIRLLVAAAAAVVVAGTAGVAMAAAGGREDPRADRGAGAQKNLPLSPSPSPSASATAQAGPGVDPCVLGTWRLTNSQHDNKISGKEVRFSGGAGAIMTYRADGLISINYNPSAAEVATVSGVRWTVLYRGTATGNVYHRGGREYQTGIRAKGTVTLYRAGRKDNSIPLRILFGPSDYRCSGDSLQFPSGTNPTEWARVR